jgi:hypothetical protein
VVRVLRYRSGGPGSIPGTTRFSKKKKKKKKEGRKGRKKKRKKERKRNQ